jgi:hypothetical protein
VIVTLLGEKNGRVQNEVMGGFQTQLKHVDTPVRIRVEGSANEEASGKVIMKSERVFAKPQQPTLSSRQFVFCYPERKRMFVGSWKVLRSSVGGRFSFDGSDAQGCLKMACLHPPFSMLGTICFWRRSANHDCSDESININIGSISR